MIVGTAGHIDHGKSALVRALTGVDTDRLKEERSRGISIDLGFAYLSAGGEPALGFVDVPGHERFVRNMLAGATGIEFVLLVVAADDGIMPQTREHLAIVDLLGLDRGLVALTKVDLVSAERRAAVAREIRDALRATTLARADVLGVSSATGEGIDALRAALLAAERETKSAHAHGRFRLAVDRCFSLAGAGTIVTGPVISGQASVGDHVVVSPAGLRARVRSIHAQNAAAESGRAGQRCALALTGDGVSKHVIGRGDVVLDPSLHAPTQRIDAELRLLASESKPLKHWTPVRAHHGARELGARVALLESAPIPPGGTGRAQLVLEAPLAAAVGDRFILRDTSASRTIGGGRFLDLRAPQRRRRTPARLAELDALAGAAPAAVLEAALAAPPLYVDIDAFVRDRALDAREREALLAAVPHVALPAEQRTFLLAPSTWQQVGVSTRAAVDAAHRAHPERPGLAEAQLARSVEPHLPAAVLAAAVRALVAAGTLATRSGALRLPEHRLTLDERDTKLWARIAPLVSGDERFRPPLASEVAKKLRHREGEVRRVLKALARQGVVIEVARDRFFERETLDEIERIVIALARDGAQGEFSAAQLRDALDNGRKVAIEILEHFDGRGLTVRRGDLRALNPRRLDLQAR